MRRRIDLGMENDDEEDVSFGLKNYYRTSIHSVPLLVSFGVVAVLMGLYGFVYTIDSTLPTPLMISDEKTHLDSFIAERARHFLKKLTDLGPRVVGSDENEVLALEMLKREINLIAHKAHKSQKVELSTQIVSGAYYLGGGKLPNGKIVSYSNLQNIVVKLHGMTNASVLINAHFDSVPTSPGGSDDGINVAVMLEILKMLSKQPTRLRNNLIFLFNGAEETGLQASHGFTTKHKWAKECKVVVNLEAAGAGGKIILFQSGPSAPWLLKYYSRVPHPYGQGAGEEIFQSNLVPSDTDFRIFRDYGGLVGLDMAFFKYGYRYHTKFDDFEHIPLGSIQHVGDNVLSLARSLGNAPEVSNPKDSSGKTVFFDCLGIFMISYTETTGCVVNIIVALFSFAIFALSLRNINLGFSKQGFKYLAVTFIAIIGGWLLSAIIVAFVAVIIDGLGHTMSWYASPCLIFGFYVAPTIEFSSILLPLTSLKNLEQNVKAQLQAHCVRIIWTLVLLIGTILRIRSMYALMLPVLFQSLGFAAVHIFKWQYTIRKWQIVYVISLVIPTLFLMYTTLTTFALFVPLTGRIGSNRNPELPIGFMAMLFTILITSPFIALVSLVRNCKYLLVFFGGVAVASYVIMLTPLGFQYTGNMESPAPERYWLLHTRRVFHSADGSETKRDSGYFLLNMDRNSPNILKNTVKEIRMARSLSEDCQQHLLCGLPLVHPKMIQIIEYSTWIPAGQPVFPEPTKMDVISKIKISHNVIRCNVSISGPDRLGVYLSPKKGVKVLNISLVDNLPNETTIWNERNIYFIIHIYGKEAAPLQFTFDVRVPNDQTEQTVELAVSGIFVHEDRNKKVPHFVQFLNEFPDWADVTAWLGSFETWWI